MSKWEWKEFEDCIERVKYTTKIPSKDYLQEGEFPIVSQEDCLISGYWNDRSDLFKVTKPIVIFGDHTKVLKYIDFDFVLGADGVKILCPKDYLNAHFFFYFLKSVNFDNLGYARHYRLLKELSVPIPPLSEQKRIVKFLDEEFSKIETLKTNAETILRNVKELFESTLEKELSLGKDGTLPSGWEWKTLQEVCLEKIKDGTHQTPKYCNADEGVPFLSAKDITTGQINWNRIKYIVPELHEELYSKIAPKKNDVLLAKNGTTGVGAIVENDAVFDIYVTLALLRPNQKIILPRYLLRVVNSPLCKKQFDAHLKGIGVPNLHLNEIQKVQIPLPPLSVQKEIVAHLDKLSEDVKRLEANYKQIIADCDELKKSILKKTFEGES